MDLLKLVSKESINNLLGAEEAKKARKAAITKAIEGKDGISFILNACVQATTNALQDPTLSKKVNLSDLFTEYGKKEINGEKVSEAISSDEFGSLIQAMCEAGELKGAVDLTRVGRGKYVGLSDAFLSQLKGEDIPEEA